MHFFVWKSFFVLAYSADPDEMPHYMWHFILVFIVCQSTCLVVPGPQKAKKRRRLISKSE